MSNKPTKTLGRFGSHWYFYAARHHLGSIGENIRVSKACWTNRDNIALVHILEASFQESSEL